MKIVLETEHLYLTKLLVKYARIYAENINNPEIYRFLTSELHHYSINEEKAWIRSIKNQPIFSIIEKDSNSVIGNCGYNKIENNIGEIGIWITPSKHNKHYGTEAITKLIEYGFNNLKLDNITLTVFETNNKAIKLYTNLGFKTYKIEENTIDGFGNPTRNIHMKLK